MTENTYLLCKGRLLYRWYTIWLKLERIQNRSRLHKEKI